MRGAASSFRLSCRLSVLAGALLATFLCSLGAGSAAGQVYGVPASVTAIQFHVAPFLPNIRPSVTSLGPYTPYNPSPIPQPYGIPRSVCAWGCRQRPVYGNRGATYFGSPYVAVPYYVSADAGTYLQSGPPETATVHVVVDVPPAQRVTASEDEERAPRIAAAPSPVKDAGPVEATVLVFRDGHQQEVSNYAIMGDTLYVFDMGRKKIALGDLDLPATIKANDDRGVEFQLPTSHPS